MPQGEMLVSAYLRTLAYAMHMGKIRADQAEYHAMLALPMNRGLAELEPVERPGWRRNLLQRWRDSGQELVEEIGHKPGSIPAQARPPPRCMSLRRRKGASSRSKSMSFSGMEHSVQGNP